jgi:hypothetical protein
MHPERATSTSQQGRASLALDIAENVIHTDIQTQEIKVQLLWQLPSCVAEIVIAPVTTSPTIVVLHFLTDSWECSSYTGLAIIEQTCDSTTCVLYGYPNISNGGLVVTIISKAMSFFLKRNKDLNTLSDLGDVVTADLGVSFIRPVKMPQTGSRERRTLWKQM